MLKRIVQSPYLNLISGLVLLVTAVNEIVTTLDDPSLGVHHGVFVYSIVHILRVVPDLMHGATQIDVAEEFTQKNQHAMD